MIRALMRHVPVAAVFLGLLAIAAPAEAKSYHAERFDTVVRVLADGTLDVTETIVFRFEDGTFREVFREIPLRRTDGVEVVAASMQGRRLPFGTETGTVEVRPRSSRVRVVWRFGPVEGVAREFQLNYRVRGVVQQQAEGDVLAWRALPSDHQYRITASDIRFELPVPPAAAPDVRSRKTGPLEVVPEGPLVRINTTNIRSDGWVEASITFPRDAFASAPPLWQQHADRVAAGSTKWLIAAGLILGTGVILLVAWRQSYDAPHDDTPSSADSLHQAAPPTDLSPAIAGVLAANGTPSLEHGMASLFGLAERGEIEISERSRGAFGQRSFMVTRRRRSQGLTPYEQAAIDTIFTEKGQPVDEVTLSTARSRLTRKFRVFSKALTAELHARGLLDPSRKALRGRYNHAGAWLLVAAAVAVLPAGLLVDAHGPWTLLIPAALAVVGIGAFIFGATITPLSNEGVRRAARLRGYRRHLTDVGRGKDSRIPDSISAVLPFAVAFGLADAWSKVMKRHHHGVPSWFHALPAGDDRRAFNAFIVSGGAGAESRGGGTGVSGGGAAGGGSSGAS